MNNRKNRNMYAQLLLHMLKRGVLEGPFNLKPEPGPLPTLPSYMVSVVSSIKLNYFANIAIYIYIKRCH